MSMEGEKKEEDNGVNERKIKLLWVNYALNLAGDRANGLGLFLVVTGRWRGGR